MKVMHKFAVLLCALFVTAALAVAQEATPAPEGAPPQNPPAAAPHGKHKMQGHNVADRLEMMSKRLNLTDEQKTKIQPILQNEAQQMRAIHQNTSLTPDQRKTQVEQVRQSSQDQIKQLLTPEQAAHIGKGPGKGNRPPDMSAWMSKNLNLTDEQKSKIDPIFANQRQQVQAIRQDSSLTQQQKQAKIEELRKSTHEQVMSVLTPEQQAQLKQMHKQRMQRNGPPAGTPPATAPTTPPGA
jgi:periplasmic protein CpxP/Spy